MNNGYHPRVKGVSPKKNLIHQNTFRLGTVLVVNSSGFDWNDLMMVRKEVSHIIVRLAIVKIELSAEFTAYFLTLFMTTILLSFTLQQLRTTF